MPQASDDQPNPAAGETKAQEQPVSPPDTAPQAPQAGSAEPVALSTGAADGAPATDKPRRRRRRRRRKGPRPADGTAPLGAEGQSAETSAAPGQTGAPVPATEAAPGSERPRERGPRERRFRERRFSPPVPGETATPPEGPRLHGPREGGQGERRFRDRRPLPSTPGEAGTPPQAPRPHVPRERGPGERRFRDRGPRPGTPDAVAGAPPPVAAEPAAREPRRNDRGPRGERRHDDRPRGGKKGKFGDRRDAPYKKPEPKLYSLESVIDRGFEEVADSENEGATKRVDWTILKRTVADQRSAKPVSAIYLLRRDGSDTEFANLSAARSAVNKTIVHPEKLTKAKADYASTKK
jgi:hypothetical protein